MNRKNWTIVALTSVLVIALGIVAQPAVADSTSAGKVAYDKHCAKCHGEDGAGATKIGEKMGLRDLGSADVQAMSDTELITITAEGKGKMPGYDKKLSKDEVKAVVDYMRTFKN